MFNAGREFNHGNYPNIYFDTKIRPDIEGGYYAPDGHLLVELTGYHTTLPGNQSKKLRDLLASSRFAIYSPQCNFAYERLNFSETQDPSRSHHPIVYYQNALRRMLLSSTDNRLRILDVDDQFSGDNWQERIGEYDRKLLVELAADNEHGISRRKIMLIYLAKREGATILTADELFRQTATFHRVPVRYVREFKGVPKPIKLDWTAMMKQDQALGQRSQMNPAYRRRY